MPGPDLKALYDLYRRHAVHFNIPWDLSEIEFIEICLSPCRLCKAPARKYEGAPFNLPTRFDSHSTLDKEHLFPLCTKCYRKRYTRMMAPAPGIDQSYAASQERARAFKEGK